MSIQDTVFEKKLGNSQTLSWHVFSFFIAGLGWFGTTPATCLRVSCRTVQVLSPSEIRKIICSAPLPVRLVGSGVLGRAQDRPAVATARCSTFAFEFRSWQPAKVMSKEYAFWSPRCQPWLLCSFTGKCLDMNLQRRWGHEMQTTSNTGGILSWDETYVDQAEQHVDLQVMWDSRNVNCSVGLGKSLLQAALSRGLTFANLSKKYR